MMKKIKASKRGLTFSLDNTDIKIGQKYRYVLDMAAHTINIIPDDLGKLKVSKKKVGKKEKPLFDLRSKEVREAIANAEYLEVEVKKDCIVVYTCKKEKARFRVLTGKRCNLADVFGAKTSQIIIPTAKVSGGECYQYTLTDWLTSCVSVEDSINTNVHQLATDTKKVYDIVSLFSGAGLFDKAWLEGGRFRFVYANDFCEDVEETYRKNIGNHIAIKDIRDVKAAEIPFADVFSSSPCCQAFSNANRHNMDSEEAEEKRLLVEEVVRLVNETDPHSRPSVIVVENVPQMMTKENGLYISKLLEGLPEYEASVQLVTDCNVGGYTQRQRCIVILSKIGKIELPEIDILPHKMVKDALSKVNATWVNYNDYTIPKPETARKMAYVPQGGNWRDIPKEVFQYKEKTHSNVMRRLAWNEVAPTIANVRKDNMMPPEGNRCLSIAEAAALMGLSSDFAFYGKLSSMQQMVANGVTNAIGKLVKNTVLNALDAHTKTEAVSIG